MKKKFLTILSFIMIFVLFFSFSFVLAQNAEIDTSTENSVDSTLLVEPRTVTSSEDDIMLINEMPVEESDVYICEDNVILDYDVNGNVFILGNDVTINSKINGNVFVLGKTVTFTENSYIYHSIFALGNNVTISGYGYNAYVCSNDVTISSGAVLLRDAYIKSSNLKIAGVIQRDAFVSSENITFDKGCINGNLEYSSKSELSIPEESVVGTINFNKIEVSSTEASNYITSVASTIIFAIIIWLLLTWLAPNFSKNISTLANGKSLLKLLGLGLLTLIVIPIISFVLMLLGITAYVALVLLAVYAILLLITIPVFTIFINNFVCEKLKVSKNIGIFGILIITSALIWALKLIPVVGTIISILSVLIGLGIIIYGILPKKQKNA